MLVGAIKEGWVKPSPQHASSYVLRGRSEEAKCVQQIMDDCASRTASQTMMIQLFCWNTLFDTALPLVRI